MAGLQWGQPGWGKGRPPAPSSLPSRPPPSAEVRLQGSGAGEVTDAEQLTGEVGVCLHGPPGVCWDDRGRDLENVRLGDEVGGRRESETGEKGGTSVDPAHSWEEGDSSHRPRGKPPGCGDAELSALVVGLLGGGQGERLAPFWGGQKSGEKGREERLRRPSQP